MGSVAGEGMNANRLAGSSSNGTPSPQSSYGRVPRGRCLPPIAPAPDPRRGEMMKSRNDPEGYSYSGAGRAIRRHPSQVVMMSKGGRDAARRPMPKWKRGYVGFKRKVKSSILVPLLLIVAVCGAGVHVVGLTGASFGYFTWTVNCEGVVTVAGSSERANGLQTYNLGWLRFEGKGPGTSSDSPTLPVDAIHDDNNNSTVGSDLGKGGVAGSSIPELGWLSSVDAFSAAFGALTAMGHLVGFAFYALKLFVVQRLFRSQFRSDRSLFRPAAKGSASLLVWMAGVGMAGFFLAAKERFVASVLTTLHSEDFLCQENKDVGGEFSFISTGFGCVASGLTFLLTWWFGEAADLALSDGFNRRKATIQGVSP